MAASAAPQCYGVGTMMGGLLGGLLRWAGASLVGIGIVIVAAMVAKADPLTLALTICLLLVAPLMIARQFPKIGSWLAAAMLVSAPFALLMVVSSTNTWIVLSGWRCGTGEMGLWLVFMPMAQAFFALGAGPLWRARRSLARVWAPMTVVSLCAAGLLLLPGAYRYSTQGTADKASVLARAHSQLLPATAPGTTVTVESLDLNVRRVCEEETCELTVAPLGEPLDDHFRSGSPIRVGEDVTIHAFAHWRIIEATVPHGTGSSLRTVVDLKRRQIIDLHVRDVALWFGPSANALALLLLAFGIVLGSTLVPSVSPLVWRRLGALRATETDSLEEIVALRSMHVAVLVVASLPMAAYAWLGLVF